MKPYNSSASKKEEIRSMFNAIAFRYDLLNRVLSLGIDRCWRAQVCRLIKKSNPTRILDVATGTADLAIMLAKACPEAHVDGVDLSEQMLAIGKKKVSQQELGDRITLSEGDAEALTASEGEYDAVTVAFGARNFEHLELGIQELHRVLKPNGMLCVLEFGMPRYKLFGALYRTYFYRILPTLGRLISKDKSAYNYLPHSVEEFPYGERFAELLTRTGVERVTIQNLFGGVAQIYQGFKAPQNSQNS